MIQYFIYYPIKDSNEPLQIAFMVESRITSHIYGRQVGSHSDRSKGFVLCRLDILYIGTRDHADIVRSQHEPRAGFGQYLSRNQVPDSVTRQHHRELHVVARCPWRENVVHGDALDDGLPIRVD